jgi:lipopolysaccharide transport system permease protein
VSEYVAAVWRCRWFWLALVKMDLVTRYRRSVLGLGWSLLHPIALTVILCTVFAPIFIDGVPNYALHVLTGLVVWQYFTGTALQGCHSLLHAESYIRQCPAPLAIFPLRTALGGLVHFLAALAVVMVARMVTLGIPPLPVWLALVPAVLLLFILGWSVAMLASLAHVLFRDTDNLLQVVFQILFYATPIIYPAQLLATYRAGWLLRCNPLVALLDLFREPVLHGRFPTIDAVAAAGAAVLVVALCAALLLRRLQRQIIFYL